MSTTTRMQLIFSLAIVLAGAGCNERPAPFEPKDRSPKAERDAPFDPPNMHPGWVYDSEKYVKPVEELKPEPRVRPGDPLHYFTNKNIVLVRQPSGYTPEEVPRVALWWTDDNGFHWNKGGYFGRQQTYFPFEVSEDGDYGIRFVGPNQPTADQVPPMPERVYHVDTVLPEVSVRIEPEQSWYHVGDTIAIQWDASDNHLIEYAVRIGAFSDFTAEKQQLVELQRDLADRGSITYKIPPEALDHELRFRVDAMDRAGNLGTAVSFALQVVGEAALPKSKDGQMETASDEEASAQSSEDEKSRAHEGVSDAVGGGNDTVSDTPVLVPLAADDGDHEDSDLLSWDGPFFDSPPRDGPKQIAKPKDTWYEQALAKITDLSAAAKKDKELVSTLAEPPVSEDTVTSKPPAEKKSTDAQTDERAPEATTPSEEAAQAAMPVEEAAAAAPDTPVTVDAAPEATDETESQSGPVPPPGFAIDNPATPETSELLALSTGKVTVLDPTRGNGLLVPLPATVEPQSSQTQFATAHPWRILGGVLNKPVQSVWALPKPRFALELYRTLEGRFLADRPNMRPAGMPGGADHAFAGRTSPTDSPATPIDEP